MAPTILALMKILYFIAFVVLLSPAQSLGQQHTGILPDHQLKFYLNEDGSQYLRITGLGQVWIRNTRMNPGSTINGTSSAAYTDISIRRLRFQLYGQLSDRVFFYTQFGQNNFNFHSPKYEGAFFHDAVLEYALVQDNKLSLGGGLTGWSGLARYASPGIGSLLALDAPLYQQVTNGVNDQFIRKLSIYAKGQIGKLDYRLAVSNPMTVSGSTAPTGERFGFSNDPPGLQVQGYLKYMFWDKESNTTPYETGTYLGKKRILTIGAGLIYQPDAMWAENTSGATVYSDMLLAGVDILLDKPLSEATALTCYAAVTNYDMGSGYIRSIGVNNPATGSSGGGVSGFGNAFPMVGTGRTLYGQLGYLFGNNLIRAEGKLQPFVAWQFSDYDYLDDPMHMMEAGLNYLTHGTQASKLSVVYQSRPVYTSSSSGQNVVAMRKGMTVLQYQVSF